VKKLITSIVILGLIAGLLFMRLPIEPAYAVPRGYDNGVQFISMSTVMTAQTDQMFTVTGGPIEILSLFGQCTTAMGGDPGDMTILLDAAAGSDYDRHFSTDVTVNTLGAGDVIRFNSATDEGVLDITANVGAGGRLSWFCSPGEIEQYTSSTGTGAITWYMCYRKLDRAARVSAN